MSNTAENFAINLDTEQGWICFMDESWEAIWHPILINGKHAPFDKFFTMEIARERFSHRTFGIATTSQMIQGNAQRDNI